MAVQGEASTSEAITAIKTTAFHLKHTKREAKKAQTEIKQTKETKKRNMRSRVRKTTTKSPAILTAASLNQIQCDLSGVVFK